MRANFPDKPPAVFAKNHRRQLAVVFVRDKTPALLLFPGANAVDALQISLDPTVLLDIPIGIFGKNRTRNTKHRNNQ